MKIDKTSGKNASQIRPKSLRANTLQTEQSVPKEFRSVSWEEVERASRKRHRAAKDLLPDLANLADSTTAIKRFKSKHLVFLLQSVEEIKSLREELRQFWRASYEEQPHNFTVSMSDLGLGASSFVITAPRSGKPSFPHTNGRVSVRVRIMQMASQKRLHVCSNEKCPRPFYIAPRQRSKNCGCCQRYARRKLARQSAR